jgi:hypothetical protein
MYVKNKKQADLFDAPVENNTRWFAPLNRDNLNAVLSGGVLAPHSSYYDYTDDPQRYAGSGILLTRNGLASSALDNEEFVGSSGYTVLAEINIKGLPAKKHQGLDIDGNQCKCLLGDVEGKAQIISFKGVLPTSRISRIHFRTESDKNNFIARCFENTPTNLIPFEASAKLFDRECTKDITGNLGNLVIKDNDTRLKEIYKKSDSFVGSAVLMTKTIPPKGNWLTLMKSILNSKNCDDLSSLMFKEAEIIQSELERSLFSVTYRMMTQADTLNGWQPKRVLSDIYDSVDKESLSKDEILKIDKWMTACTDILDNKRQVTPLTDSRMKIGRAILLLLLRPDPVDIIDSTHSSLEPGLEVLSLAAILSGARYGFEGLTNDIKSAMPGYDLCANLKADLMNRNCADSLMRKHSDAPTVAVNISDWGVMGQSFKLLVGNDELINKNNEGSLELRLVITIAEAAGIKLKYERSHNRLSYRYEFKDNRSQIVYISVGAPNESDEATIRFWSPCLDVSTKEGKKRLRSMRDKLLAKNCELNIYCRFGVCPIEKAVMALSDQIVVTMDQRELISGLEHVAITADNFEKEMGLDIY